MQDDFANTPQPPYYAVIFTSRLGLNDAGYDAMGDAMVTLAEHQPGFLGIESTRGNDRIGITVSYWKDETSIFGLEEPDQAPFSTKEWHRKVV